MKVYIAFECSYDGAHVWRDANRVFGNETAAAAWVEEVTHSESVWREYDEYEVE